jgi:hypothetical protein
MKSTKICPDIEWGNKMATNLYARKRQRTGALHNLADDATPTYRAPASWNAPVLWRFFRRFAGMR